MCHKFDEKCNVIFGRFLIRDCVDHGLFWLRVLRGASEGIELFDVRLNAYLKTSVVL